MGRLMCVSLAILLVHVVSSQEVNFGGDEQVSVDEQVPVEGDVLLKTDGLNEDGLSEDVETRFISGFDLNTFAGQVAAASVGTVIGNVGTNLAGNYLNGCNRRGKRSASERMYVNELMHNIAKRQALEEASEKSGNAETNADPEVATRLFCPQDFLSSGGSNSGSSYCDRCYCSDWNCRRDCRKCGNLGWSSGNSNSGSYRPQNSGSHNHNRPQNSGNYYPQNSGAHSHNSQTTTYVNCNTCYCSNYSCKNKCSKCRNNYNNNNNNYGSSWSSWSNSGNYNQGGYRTSGRSGADSEETTLVPEIVVPESSSASNTDNSDEVVFA